jgi:hypothetical protein
MDATAVVTEEGVAREQGSSSDAPPTTIEEDQAANDEAMIAAFIAADLQALDSELPPQDGINADTSPAPPLPAVSGGQTDTWDGDLVPPPQVAAVGDVVDIRSEGSSANEEPPRPVPHVYGFIQLFDAVTQEFRVHSTFIAKESATIKDTVRHALGYPADKEFLVWTRQKSYRTAGVSASTVFEALDCKSDGFVLIVGDVHSEST